MQKLLPDYVAKLQKDAGVEILDDRLKPPVVPQETAPATLAATNSPVKLQSK